MSIIRTNIENARTIVSSNPVLPANTAIGNVSSTELSYLDGVTSALQTQLSSKANVSSPIFTGNGITMPSLSTDPSSPIVGQMYYNSTNKSVKNYNGLGWDIMTNKFSASGGSIAENNGYRMHVFTSSGTFTVLSAGIIDILLVGGGGAGAAAGGGAGGVLFQQNVTVFPSTYSIYVGAGGAAQYAFPGNGSSQHHGENTYTNISGVGIAYKGEGAYGWDIQPDQTMGVYGSGAGIGQSSTSGYSNSGGYTVGQGYPGGQDGSDYSPYPSGGGGGAGGAGGAGGGNTSGNGGVGVNMSSYFGTSVGQSGWFGGGGGGANHEAPLNNSTGGNGGGGSYIAGNQSIRNGLPNTGGGGAGAANPAFDNIMAGAGGSGVVIIRYKF